MSYAGWTINNGRPLQAHANAAPIRRQSFPDNLSRYVSEALVQDKGLKP